MDFDDSTSSPYQYGGNGQNAADFFGVGIPSSSGSSGGLFGNGSNSSLSSSSPYNESVVATPAPEVINPLSDNQEIVMSVLFVLSGLLSVIGSTTIVVKVIRNRLKSTPYDRIMLGLSGCDIIASVSWILTPFLLPSDYGGARVWAIGNEGTCTFLGTLSQFGFCAVVYNLVLSCYYLLTVRFGIKRQLFAKHYELWIHIIPLAYFTITSIGGAIVGVYSEVDLGMGCWVNDFPHTCELEPETCRSARIGWAFGAGPTILTFLALIINNLIIYCFVKKKLKVPSVTSPTISRESKNKNDTSRTRQGSSRNHSIASTPHILANSASIADRRIENGSNDIHYDDNEIASKDQDDDVDDIEDGLNADEAWDQLQQQSLQQQLRMQQRQQQYIREVAAQGFLYVGTFFVAYTPAFALRAIEVYGSYPLEEEPLFPLFVLVSLLLPLQGFFNMFVYNRPNYTRVRRAYPDHSVLWAIKTACLDSKIPKLSTDTRNGTYGAGIAGRGSSSKKKSGGPIIGASRNKKKKASSKGDEKQIAKRYEEIQRDRVSSCAKNFSSGLQMVCEGSKEEEEDSTTSGEENRRDVDDEAERDQYDEPSDAVDVEDALSNKNYDFDLDCTGETTNIDYDHTSSFGSLHEMVEIYENDDSAVCENGESGKYGHDLNLRTPLETAKAVISDALPSFATSERTRTTPAYNSHRNHSKGKIGSSGPSKMISFDGSIHESYHSTTTVDA